MPSMRDEILEAAMPAITKVFGAVSEGKTRGRLFSAVGVRSPKDSRPARTSAQPPVPLAGVALPDPASAWTINGETHRFVIRTVAELDADDIEALDLRRDDLPPAVEAKIVRIGTDANKAAASILSYYLSETLDLPDSPTPLGAMAEVPARVRACRELLNADAVNVLLRAPDWESLTADKSLSSSIALSLRGGEIAPVTGVPRGQVWLTRARSGDIAVEAIRDLTLRWDFVGDRGVALVATEEFRIVKVRDVPAKRFELP